MPPNNKTVQQMGLEKKPDARIGFKVKGTIVYAKRRTNAGRAQLAWDTWVGRPQNRREAAALAVRRLETRINSFAGAASLLQGQLQAVQSQIAESDSVRAKDLRALLDGIDGLETRELRFNKHVQSAAAQLDTNSTKLSIRALYAKRVTPKFSRTDIASFLAFIQKTAACDLNLVGKDPLDYRQALAFAKNWVDAEPKQNLGSPKDRYLIDNLVNLVLRGSGVKASPPAQPSLTAFQLEGTRLKRKDGKLFVRDEVPLGEGAFGSVHIYRCAEDDETVVGKVFKQLDDSDPQAEAQVHAQAQSGQAGYIVPLLGAVKLPDDGLMLVLEHAPNGDAAKIHDSILSKLKTDKLDGPSASHAFMTMFADMVQGVVNAHSNGVMHLDLKPDNFVVDRDGKSHLVDFGVSQNGLAKTMLRPVESPDFAAPEAIRNLKQQGLITYQADIWSLGAILYQFNSPRLTDANKTSATPSDLRPFPHKFLHEGDGLIEAFAQADESKRRAQLGLFEDNQLHELIFKMLDPDPSKRPSLEAVLAHPRVAPYANPSGPDEEAIERSARRLILEAGEQLLDV